LIKLIVQVLDDVLRFTRGEFFVCHMTAVAQPLLQRIQRMNESVIAGVDASVIASNAVGVMQALAFGAPVDFAGPLEPTFGAPSLSPLTPVVVL
jgi:hypothetical protein